MKFAIHAFLLAALLATAVAAPAPGVPKAPLAVTLSLSGDMKSIQADVTNTGAESLDVITLHTPLSTDDQGGYQVSDQTRILTFTGLVKAYITSNLSDFHQTIAPGMTVTVLWSLSLVDFANSTGPYYASTSGIFQYLPSNADADTEYLLGEYGSNKLQFDNAPPRTQIRSNDAVLVYTETCPSSQLSVLDAAGSDYGQLADAGVGALTGGQDKVFAEFFGKGVSATQYRTVTNRFYQLQGAKKYANTQEEQPITFSFSCHDYFQGCKPGVGAYVKAPENNVVTFCPPFFSSRMTALSYLCSSPYYQPSNDGVYYRGANLLHEFMHLQSVMDSQPLIDETLNNGNRAYGYAASKLLATQNSAKARKNPENYKYFAEVEYARKRGGACTRDEL